MNTTARQRRHEQRARQQGKADGPATLNAMAQVYTTARLQRILTEHVHDSACIVTAESGRRWCTEQERYL